MGVGLSLEISLFLKFSIKFLLLFYGKIEIKTMKNTIKCQIAIEFKQYIIKSLLSAKFYIVQMTSNTSIFANRNLK